MEYNACGITPSIHAFVIDPITLQPLGTNCNGLNPANSFGNANDLCACRTRVENYFIFRQNTPQQRENLKNFLINLNSNYQGYYVGMYTMISTGFQNYAQGIDFKCFCIVGRRFCAVYGHQFPKPPLGLFYAYRLPAFTN